MIFDDKHKLYVNNYSGFFIACDTIEISTKTIFPPDGGERTIEIKHWPDEMGLSLGSLFFKTILEKPEFAIALWNRKNGN
jgi:hypothetical protein